MPGVFPDYPAPVVRKAAGERELTMMRWGMPPPPRAGGFPVTNIRNTTSPHWRGWLKPEIPGKQLRGIRAGAKPGNEKEGRRLVRAERRPTAVCLRWYLDRIQGRPRHQIKADPRPSPGLRLPDDRAERDHRTDPSEGDASDPNNARGARRLDARAMGRVKSVATAPARRRVEDRSARGRQGGPRGSDMIRWLIDFRFAVHYGLNSDIARGQQRKWPTLFDPRRRWRGAFLRGRAGRYVRRRLRSRPH
jgi:hypothetical protein